MNDGEMSFIVYRFQRRESRMEAEEAVKVDGARLGVAGTRRRDCNLRPQGGVVAISEWGYHRNAIGCAALKDSNKDRPIFSGR